MQLTIEEYFTTEGGLEQFLEFDCEYHSGSDDHFCNGHGNWLPGDEPYCKIREVRFNGKVVEGAVKTFLLSEYSRSVIEKVFKQVAA